jgi:tRNA pseudouridine55 synthase
MNFNFPAGEILSIDKPLTWSSYDVVRKVKKIIIDNLRIKIKVGHAGTLDPLATGLLIVCTGNKTKGISTIQGMPKIYEGQMKLGEATPSFDGETSVSGFEDISGISEEDIRLNVNKFIGTIEQKPPIFSAIKLSGERSYIKARKGETPVMPVREVTIYEFDILSVQMPFVNFKVKCSKGTYIRSLVNDFGLALNNKAWLTSLTRVSIGNYHLKDALSLQDFENLVKQNQQDIHQP